MTDRFRVNDKGAEVYIGPVVNWRYTDLLDNVCQLCSEYFLLDDEVFLTTEYDAMHIDCVLNVLEQAKLVGTSDVEFEHYRQILKDRLDHGSSG